MAKKKSKKGILQTISHESKAIYKLTADYLSKWGVKTKKQLKKVPQATEEALTTTQKSLSKSLGKTSKQAKKQLKKLPKTTEKMLATTQKSLSKSLGKTSKQAKKQLKKLPKTTEKMLATTQKSLSKSLGKTSKQAKKQLKKLPKTTDKMISKASASLKDFSRDAEGKLKDLTSTISSSKLFESNQKSTKAAAAAVATTKKSQRLFYSTLAAPVGKLHLLVTKSKVVAVSFKKLPGKDFLVDESLPILKELKKQLNSYFKGDLKEFTIKYQLRGSPYYIKIWRNLAKVPYGQTVSYKNLAGKIRPKANPRVVGTAMRKNPLPIILPCHRVIGSDGKLHNYGGGIKNKQWLIDLEARNAASSNTKNP